MPPNDAKKITFDLGFLVTLAPVVVIGAIAWGAMRSDVNRMLTAIEAKADRSEVDSLRESVLGLKSATADLARAVSTMAATDAAHSAQLGSVVAEMQRIRDRLDRVIDGPKKP